MMFLISNRIGCMEVVEVLDALAYHDKQVAYHQAQLLRVLGDYAVACEGEDARRTNRIWEVSQPEPGRFRLRSPAGKTYHRDPEPVLGDPPPF